MSAAVTLNLSIKYTLIELLCTFVNLEEIRKEIYKMILKKESRIFFFQQNSSCYIKLAPPPSLCIQAHFVRPCTFLI